MRHTGREVWAARWARAGATGRGTAGRASGGLGAAEGTRGNVGGLPGRVARGQRAGCLGGHGSSLTRTHALGPTEELAGAIEFVSGKCHRCHRYRNPISIRAFTAITKHQDDAPNHRGHERASVRRSATRGVNSPAAGKSLPRYVTR